MRNMVQISAEALRTYDAELAKMIAKTKNEVDDLFNEYLDQLEEHVPTTSCVLSNLLMVRDLERVADHATYMSESITYIATGEKVSLR